MHGLIRSGRGSGRPVRYRARAALAGVGPRDETTARDTARVAERAAHWMHAASRGPPD